MELWQAAVYGVVEGVTEFLPISSTGHLMLARYFLGIEGTDFVKTFEIAIQFGAILAVIVLYPKRLFLDRGAMLRISVALVPTLILGALTYPVIKTLQGMIVVVPFSLLIGGFVLIWFERFVPDRDRCDISVIPLRTALFIGLLQGISFIPGISRSGTTIVSAMALGLHKKDAVEFSFLLAAPTMLAATVLDLSKQYGTFSEANVTALIVGFVVSFFVALFAIKFLVKFITSHTFMLFGVYRIIVGILLLVMFIP
jgi:undecaprenyl-diphosphatase